MYACNAVTLDQLLSVRDGEPVAADVISHTIECALCARELKRLRALKIELKSLIELTPPAYDPIALRKQLERSESRGNRWPSVAAAASVSAIAILLVLSSARRVD